MPNAVGPGCATPLPGRIAATDHGVTGLSVASETATLVPPADPTRHVVTAREGMRRATLAGPAGVQIAGRTARTLWEHRPYEVLREGTKPSLPRGKQHHFAEKQHGLGEPRDPTGPRVHIDPCGYDGPDGGGRGRTLAPAARYPTTSRSGRGSSWRRPASSVLDEVEDAGPPMPTGPMLHAEGRCAIGTVRGGARGHARTSIDPNTLLIGS